jgi:hypothetical protein
MKAFRRELFIKPDGRIVVFNYFKGNGVFLGSYFPTDSTKGRIESISWRRDVEGEVFYDEGEWTFELWVSGKLP